jgi:hypothetical protein
LQDECQYFKQQLFNEVRRTIMLDYFSSRENFLDVGEQYTNHMGSNLKEWHKFITFYSDLNNARKDKDEEYKREQFIGEELDWKMLADNLTLFQSQMNDIQDLRGYDPNSSLAMDQSINIGSGDGYGGDSNENVPFKADESMVASYRKSETYQPPDQLISKSDSDDIKPHPNQATGETQSIARSNTLEPSVD